MASQEHGAGHTAGQQLIPGEKPHPGPGQYLKIGAILGVITAVEVALVYIAAVRSVLPPILIILSATKFALVAMFYMHLKFDNRLFSAVFVFGLLIAASIMVTLLALFAAF